MIQVAFVSFAFGFWIFFRIFVITFERTLAHCTYNLTKFMTNDISSSKIYRAHQLITRATVFEDLPQNSLVTLCISFKRLQTDYNNIICKQKNII